jgi:hypothetical protein
MNDFENIYMKFGNEFWLILFREYISPKLFAVCALYGNVHSRGVGNSCTPALPHQNTVKAKDREIKLPVFLLTM